ncbi:MAG: DUF2958 domain-containing protein [Rhodomicrobium sp.]
MKLLTKELRDKLLVNGREQAKVKGTKAEKDFWPVVKLFYPASGATWLLTEIDPQDEDVAWALCDLGMGFPEFGTVRLSELESFRGRCGLGIERDKYFEAMAPISRYIDAASEAGHITEQVTP